MDLGLVVWVKEKNQYYKVTRIDIEKKNVWFRDEWYTMCCTFDECILFKKVNMGTYEEQS